MARIEWAQLCELAYLDRCERLCVVGVTNRFPVPSLPLAVHQIMIAARVVEARLGETIDVALSIQAPNGLWTAPTGPEGYELSLAGEYVLITLRDLPLNEEGVHRFELSLGGGQPVTILIPVFRVSTPRHENIH